MSERVTASTMKSDSDSVLGRIARVQSNPEGDTGGFLNATEVSWLIKSLGIYMPTPLLRISQVSPSLILQMFRKLFAIDVEMQLREHETEEDEVHNMSVLIGVLRDSIPTCPVIDPVAVVRRDTNHLHDLINLFINVHQIQLENGGGADNQSTASSYVDKLDQVRGYIDELIHDVYRDSGAPTPRDEITSHGRSAQPHGPSDGNVTSAEVTNAAMRQNATDVGIRIQQAMNTAPGRQPMRGQRGYCGVYGFQAERAIRVTCRNRERDRMIQELRAQRFEESVRSFAVAQKKAESSYADALRRKELAHNLHMERLAAAEMRRLASDDDAAQRQHYLNHMHSKANARRGSIELSSQRRASSSARDLAFDRHHDNFRSYVAITSAMSTWRHRVPHADVLSR